MSTTYSLKATPLPITAELQIEHREFPGPISGANPTLTSLEPEDPEREHQRGYLGNALRVKHGTRSPFTSQIKWGRNSQWKSRFHLDIHPTP